MAAESEILRNYIIKLGYQIDRSSSNSFLKGISAVDKKILKQKVKIDKINKKMILEQDKRTKQQLKQQKAMETLELSRLNRIKAMSTAAIANVATLTLGMTALAAATVVATSKYADYMRQLYAKKELTGTTIQGLKGMELTAKGLGISPDAYESTAKNVYQGIVGNPAIKQLTEQLTKLRVTGENTEEILWGIVDAAQRMSNQEWAQIKWSELMGVPQEMFMLMKNHPEIRQRKNEATEIYSNFGIDPKASEEMFKEYAHQIDLIKLKFEALGLVIMETMSNPISEVISDVNGWLDDLPGKIAKLKNGTGHWWDVLPGMDTFDVDMDSLRNETNWVDYVRDGVAAGMEEFDSMKTSKPVKGTKDFFEWYADTYMGGLNDFASRFAEPSHGSMRLVPFDDAFLGNTGQSSNTTNNSSNTYHNITNNITNNITGDNPDDIALKSSNRTLEAIQRNLNNPFGPGR